MKIVMDEQQYQELENLIDIFKGMFLYFYLILVLIVKLSNEKNIILYLV